MRNNELNILNLSPHLFWDVDVSQLDAQRNKSLIIQRVLDYGLLTDWKLISKSYGIDEIASVAMLLRELDPRSLSFISALSKKPKEQFRCFITKQSTPQHWNF